MCKKLNLVKFKHNSSRIVKQIKHLLSYLTNIISAITIIIKTAHEFR